MGYSVWRSALLVIAVAALAACSQTTRVGEDTSTDGLAKSGKGGAVMRLGMASQNCRHVGVWLAVREGLGFRPHTPVAVIHATSLDDVPIAEVELPPGEYHVVSYACGTGKNVKQVDSFDITTGLVRKSYASFSVAAGEVVNVGSFEYHASRSGLNAFGRQLRITVGVKDWPLDEIERYRKKRPQIYAQMRTRLMTVTPGAGPPGEAECAEFRRLTADGKVQDVPEDCAEQAPAKAASKKR